MTEDELIREIQLKKQLSELDGSPVPEYDSSESMTAEELRSDNRFLIEQLKEALEENRRLKEDISEIKQDLKESNRRADEEAAGRKRLFDKLEKFMDDQKSASDKYKVLERKYETLQGRYDFPVQPITVEARLVAISIAVRRMRESMMAVTILTELNSLCLQGHLALWKSLQMTPMSRLEINSKVNLGKDQSSRLAIMVLTEPVPSIIRRR